MRPMNEVSGIVSFLRESLAIESIFRMPSVTEVKASMVFLDRYSVSFGDLQSIQMVYAPGAELRSRPGMNVRVGNHQPPEGGEGIAEALKNLLIRVNGGGDPWSMHVEFETLHPFMDGNGRTGRILWAWNMLSLGQDPFSLPFLHRWYYQTLERVGR